MGSQTAAFKFTGVRILSNLGWGISLRSLCLLFIATYFVLLLTAFSGALFVLRLIRDASALGTTGNTGQSLAPVPLVAAAVCVYLALGSWLREAFSSRRYAVQRSPNRDLYRTVDVGMNHVFIAEAVPRFMLLFGLSAAVCVAAFLTVHEQGQAVSVWHGFLLLLPFLVAGSWLALSSRFAAKEIRRRAAIWDISLAAVACVVIGLSGVCLGRVVNSSDKLGDFPGLVFPQGGGEQGAGAVLAAGVATLLLFVLIIRNLRSIKRSPFPITARVLSTAESGVKTESTSPHRLFRRFLVMNIVKDGSFVLLTEIGFCFLLIASLAVGLRMGDIGPELFTTIPGWSSIPAFVVFMVSLIGSELICRGNNPAGMLPQLRFAWEAGVPVAKLTRSVLITQALPMMMLAAPAIAAAVWALSGTLPLPLIFIPWSISMASIIGNTCSAVLLIQADGTTETSLAAAFITVILSVPTLGLVLLDGGYPFIAAGSYTILLTGGAHLCQQRRILTRR